MEFYVLDNNFLKTETIDNFQSMVWTERFNTPGDFELVVPATVDNINQYAPETFLSKNESKEIMIIDTQKIKNNQLTLTGSSLMGFLDNRVHGYGYFFGAYPTFLAPYNDDWAAGYAGLVIKSIMENMLINNWGPGYGTPDLDDIPNLSTGPYAYGIDRPGSISLPRGDLLTTITTLAQLDSLGFSIYLDSVTPGGSPPYSIKFKTYEGLDRTTNQSTNPPIIFSEELGNIEDLEEVRSIKAYKNVCYVQIPNEIRIARPEALRLQAYFRVESEPNPPRLGWQARSMRIAPTDMPAYTTEAALINNLTLRGQAALAQTTKQQLIDGNIIKMPSTLFGVDYSMGDIVEIRSSYGITHKVRITEYIWSKNETGEKEYPTFEIVA